MRTVGSGVRGLVGVKPLGRAAVGVQVRQGTGVVRHPVQGGHRGGSREEAEREAEPPPLFPVGEAPQRHAQRGLGAQVQRDAQPEDGLVLARQPLRSSPPTSGLAFNTSVRNPFLAGPGHQSGESLLPGEAMGAPADSGGKGYLMNL